MAEDLPELNASLLSFAYKYPFSKEAKELIKQIGLQRIEDKFITAGLLRINEALENKKVEFVSTSYPELMYTYLMSYVYARMLASATGNSYIVKKFIVAEADRASSALALDNDENVVVLAKELGIRISLEENIKMPFDEFLKFASGKEGLHLYSMKIKKGEVELEKEKAILLMRSAIEAEIAKGLPISQKELPREILIAAKAIKLPEAKAAGEASGKYAWIEKLLATPIPDIRHRTVNLILAPYLTNIKKLDEEKAAEIIIEYIDRCKQLNPDTRVNEAYIRYQCKYAKSHGLKPLSLARAKELFSGIIDLG